MRRLVQVGLVLAIVAAVPVQAAVDLEWRVENEIIQVGDTVRIGLYAVADNDGADEPFSLIEVVLQWDADVLGLLGVDDNGPYAWWVSGFVDDSGLDGLNDTFDDGDADYQAWPDFFGDLPIATTEGLLVTTFEFEALAPAEATDVAMIEAFGSYAVTAVYDDEYGGWNIVDDIDSESLEITVLAGDLDGDGDVDLADLSALLAVYGLCDGDPGFDPVADIDGDGCVGLADLSALLANYGT